MSPEDVPDPDLLRHVRLETGATHLRFDLDYRRKDAEALIDLVRGAGYIPLPILNWAWSENHTQHVNIHTYTKFCRTIVDKCSLDEVEVLNEPRIMGGMDGITYAAFAAPACRALRECVRAVTIILAGDYLQPDREGPQVHGYWMKDVRSMVNDALYDVIALHTYREPAPPETTRYPSRAEEWERFVEPLPVGIPVQVTEVGWNLAGVNQDQQGAYIKEELEINLSLGIEATYIYAPIPGDPSRDFGLFNHDWTPRPSAIAMKEFCSRLP